MGLIVVSHPNERTCTSCWETNTEYGRRGHCTVCEGYTEFVYTLSYLREGEYRLETEMEIKNEWKEDEFV